MNKISIGEKVPHFNELGATTGKHVVLYFYPKDNTPGCTKEACGFRDALQEYAQLDAEIIGVSRDSEKSHHKFKQEFQLPFKLISDEDETFCQRFDVIKNKNMYGKEVRGIERSTFLIDKNGVLRKEWRNVKVDGHVDEVKGALKAL